MRARSTIAATRISTGMASRSNQIRRRCQRSIVDPLRRTTGVREPRAADPGHPGPEGAAAIGIASDARHLAELLFLDRRVWSVVDRPVSVPDEHALRVVASLERDRVELRVG